MNNNWLVYTGGFPFFLLVALGSLILTFKWKLKGWVLVITILGLGMVWAWLCINFIR